MCLPYATSTTHTEQLEDILDGVIDEACARAGITVELARNALNRTTSLSTEITRQTHQGQLADVARQLPDPE